MSVYEKNDAKDRSEDRELYHHFKTFKTSDSLGEITSLSLSPGEENLAVFFSSNQVPPVMTYRVTSHVTCHVTAAMPPLPTRG